MKTRLLIPACLLAALGTVQAATVMANGTTVSGTTLSLSLDADVVTASSGMDSNDLDGNLVLTYPTAAGDDFWVRWDFASGTVPSATYKYVQVDFSSVTVGADAGQWSVSYLDDDDKTFGDSIHSVGTVALQTTPFSVVIDLTSGAPAGKEWGTGDITGFRLDMFEPFNNANDGKVFTISGVTLGSAAVPEPSAALLGGLGLLVLLRRRRA